MSGGHDDHGHGKSHGGKASLEDIANQIGPEKMLELSKKHDKAREDYKGKIDIKGHEEFRDELISYVKHHKKEVHGEKEMSDENALYIAEKILERSKYRGYEGALDSVMKNGNMKDMYDMISDTLKEEHRESKVQHAIRKHVDPNDFEHHVELTKQFIDKYKGVLPKGTTSKSPEELAKQYQRFIMTYDALSRQVEDNIGKKEKGHGHGDHGGGHDAHGGDHH